MYQLDRFKKTVLAVVGLFIVGGVIAGLFQVGRNKGYAPEQPIPFSHKIHAGQYNIPCMYCHSGVEKSKHATIPSMNVCMNCHSVVKPDSPHIQKLKQMVQEKKEPFEWVKVHDLPDFVHFNHKRHIARGVECETCHGDVKRMSRVRQDKSMSMGWCLDCHRGQSTPGYVYEQDAANKIQMQGKTTKSPHGSSHGLKDLTSGVKGTAVAPASCYTCHH